MPGPGEGTRLYVARTVGLRLLAVPVLIFLIGTAVFLMIRVVPGDPALQIAGPYADEAAIEAVHSELGLDQPLVVQYGDFLAGLAQGDLGDSYLTGRPVIEELRLRLPATLELLAVAFVFALAWGGTLGTLGGYYRHRMPDSLTRVVTSVQQAVPDFVAGLFLLYFIAFQLDLLPQATGRLGIGSVDPSRVTGFLVIDSLLSGDMAAFRDSVAHLILPGIALGFTISAVLARMVRSALGTAMESDHVQFARSNGLPKRTVLYYAFADARSPVLTHLAIVLGTVLGGTAIIEKVFNWRGIGAWGVDSITQIDMPAIQGFVMFMGAAVAILYVLLDVAILLLDPRVR